MVLELDTSESRREIIQAFFKRVIAEDKEDHLHRSCEE